MDGVGHLLYRQGLSQHTRLADGAVVGENLDDLTRQLSRTAPGNRVLVHRHARVAAVADQRVAHRLQVGAEHPHPSVAVHLTVDRVGIDVERLHAHRVGVHIDRVLLRIVLDQGAARGKALAGLLIIDHLTAGQFVLVLLVHIHHITVAAVLPRLAIIE